MVEQPASDPFVQEEREATLYHLRQYTMPNGEIPAEFDSLLRETFAELYAHQAL